MALQSLRESYLMFPVSTLIDVRPLQPENTPLLMKVTLFGMVTEVRPQQPQKALPSMLVTPFPIVMEVRPQQLEKAFASILVTLLGIVAVVIHGLHFTTILSLINKPSFVSSSQRVAPQLLPLVKAE